MRSTLRTANQLTAIRPRGSSNSPFSYICPEDGVRATSDRIKAQKLKGKCIAVKDNFLVQGIPTTCSSRMLQAFDSPYTATSIQHLLASGATITAKTQMDEFGMGNMTTHLPPGATAVYNPWRTRSGEGEVEEEPRSAGGSSGGSAAAVKAGLAWAALGTDTGGSVRLPASYCDLVGLKPSHGMISRHGVVSYADTLDCVGTLTNTVEDAHTLFDIMSCPDQRDSTCVSSETRDRAHGVEYDARRRMNGLKDGRLDGVRIGIPIETCVEASLTPLDMGPILKHLRSLGATILPISIRSIRLALPAYYVLACAEASSNLARYGGGWYGGNPESSELDQDAVNRRLETRRWGFGEEVKKRILAGTYALTAGAFNNSYLKALQLRQRLRSDFNNVFRAEHPLREAEHKTSATRGVDCLLHLTAIQTAPKLNSATGDTSSDARGYAQDLLTVPASLGGLPSVSIPAGTAEDGWPVGLSLTGQWGSETVLLDIGRLGIESFNANRVQST